MSDGEWTYTWQNGRQLASMTDGNTTWTFTYDANGMRTGRSPGYEQATYAYVYNGSKLSQMTVQGVTLRFAYDKSGNPLTVTVDNSSVYYYKTNLQGDVIGILNSAGIQVVTYAYDAWGNVQILQQSDQIVEFNPLLYRGYVYDWETGLYYLQSRYYNPQWGRFINGDAFAATGQGLLGNNMFAYCRNNPVRRKDISGTADVEIFDDGDSNLLDDDKTFSGGKMSNGGSNVKISSGSSGGTKVGSGSGGNGGNSGLNTSPGGGGSTSYTYSAPPGGGGVSSSIQVGNTTVTFGHGGRHVGGSDISGLESAIANDVVTQPPTAGKVVNVPFVYNGVDLIYGYFTRSSTCINVGTYYAVKK